MGEHVQFTQEDIDKMESGVDWLTWVIPGSDSERHSHRWAWDFFDAVAACHSQKTPWRSRGYTGWSTKGLAMGSRADGIVINCGSQVASKSWRLFASLGGHPTRLDLQTTVSFKQPKRSIVDSDWNCLRPGPQTRRPPRNGSMSARLDGSSMMTLGSRAHERYVRVYDKGVEAKTHEPGVRWRIELEAKGNLARRLWALALKSESIQHFSYLYSCSALVRAGATWPLPLGALEVPLATPRAAAPKSHTDNLRWLQTQVGPMLRRMANQRGPDYVWQVIAELLNDTTPLPAPRRPRANELLPGEQWQSFK
jgi:hypothetical protein